MGRERPRARGARGARAATPRACTARSRRASRRALGDAVRVRTATLEQPEHGLTAGRPGRHRRADLVGPHRPRRGLRRGRGARPRRRCSAAWACSPCTRRTTRRSSSACSGRSCSLRWRNDGERELVWTVDPSHPIAAGVPHPIVHRRAGDVRRARSPSRRPTSSSSSARSPAARCSAAAAASPRRRPDLLLQPGRPGLPGLPPPRCPAGARQRRAVGGAAAAPGARAGQRRVAGRVVGVRERADLRVGVVGVGWAGQQHIKAYAAHRRRRAAPAIAGLEEDEREALAARVRRSRTASRAGRTCSTLDGLDAISVAVPTFLHAPIAIAALERGLHVLSEKPIALERRRGATRWSRPRARPAACSRSRSTTAGAATSRSSSGRRRRPAGPPLLREGVVAAAHRHPDARLLVHAVPSWRAAGRWSTSACTCSTTRCSCSATRR